MSGSATMSGLLQEPCSRGGVHSTSAVQQVHGFLLGTRGSFPSPVPVVPLFAPHSFGLSLDLPLGLTLTYATPRSTHDLVAMDGWLYAVGGNDGSSSLNSIEKYNPRTNKWVAASCMFTRRSSVGVAVLELLNFPPPSSPTLSVSSTSL